MRGIAAAFVAMGVAGGVAVGVGQYQAATPDRTDAVSAPVPLPTARPTVVKVQVQPCEPGWALKKGACVKVVERVVTVPAAPAPVARRAPAAPRTAPSTTPVRTSSHRGEDSGRDDSDEVVDDDGEHDEPGEDSEEFEEHEDD